MPSYASTAAAAVFSLNHALCKDIATRYLAAFLNDMARSFGLVQELIGGNQEYLEVKIPNYFVGFLSGWTIKWRIECYTILLCKGRINQNVPKKGLSCTNSNTCI